jgi:hypothetical protein
LNSTIYVPVVPRPIDHDAILCHQPSSPFFFAPIFLGLAFDGGRRRTLAADILALGKANRVGCAGGAGTNAAVENSGLARHDRPRASGVGQCKNARRSQWTMKK